MNIEIGNLETMLKYRKKYFIILVISKFINNSYNKIHFYFYFYLKNLFQFYKKLIMNREELPF